LNGFGADLHILFLTDNFSPESNAPASRTFEHCREWVRAGHQVTNGPLAAWRYDRKNLELQMQQVLVNLVKK
jgi:hypothetical protein